MPKFWQFSLQLMEKSYKFMRARTGCASQVHYGEMLNWIILSYSRVFVLCSYFFSYHIIFKILYKIWYIFFYPYNFDIFVYLYRVHVIFFIVSCLLSYFNYFSFIMFISCNRIVSSIVKSNHTHTVIVLADYFLFKAYLELI